MMCECSGTVDAICFLKASLKSDYLLLKQALIICSFLDSKGHSVSKWKPQIVEHRILKGVI